MESNRIKDLNLLGHKRNEEKLSNEGQSKIIEQEKSKDTKNQKLALKRPEFFNSFKSQDNNINLDEKNDEIDINRGTNGENIIRNSICEKCGSRNNILIFSNLKNILQYFSKKNIILLFEISEFANKYENFEFVKLKKICSDCLLKISRNKMEFENFITASNEINDYPFNNLFKNSYLKNFNNKETKKNNKNMSPGLNDINKKFLEMLGQNEKINIFSSPINNISNNNGTQNLNLEFLNPLNNPFLPCINYNMPFNQNISNLNIPNYYHLNNDLNSLFSLNNILKNPEIKENNNNINNLNYPLFLTNNLLNPPLGILSQDINNILNISQSSSLNKDYSMEKNNDINPNLSSSVSEKNKTTNDINKKNEDNSYIHKEKNHEKEIQNNTNKNYTIIQNKDFEEIFSLVSQLYNKLLNIKIAQKFDLNQNGTNYQENKDFLANNTNSNNIKGKNNNSINLDLNRVNNSKKDNYFNDFLLNKGNINYNNNLYSNSNTVNNSINRSNINETTINNQAKAKEINSIYNISENLNGNKKESIK